MKMVVVSILLAAAGLTVAVLCAATGEIVWAMVLTFLAGVITAFVADRWADMR